MLAAMRCGDWLELVRLGKSSGRSRWETPGGVPRRALWGNSPRGSPTGVPPPRGGFNGSPSGAVPGDSTFLPAVTRCGDSPERPCGEIPRPPPLPGSRGDTPRGFGVIAQHTIPSPQTPFPLRQLRCLATARNQSHWSGKAAANFSTVNVRLGRAKRAEVPLATTSAITCARASQRKP